MHAIDATCRTAARGDSLWFTTARLTVCQSNVDDPGRPSIIEHRMAGGFAPPRHVHHDEDETFYILEGRFRFEAAGRVRHLGPGEAIHLPRGIAHGFVVTSAEGGRCLTVTNGGFEAMVRDASSPALGDGLPEQREPTPQMQAQLGSTCRDHGIELVGPPLGVGNDG